MEHGTRLTVVFGYSVKINETENDANEGRCPCNGVNLTDVGEDQSRALDRAIRPPTNIGQRKGRRLRITLHSKSNVVRNSQLEKAGLSCALCVGETWRAGAGRTHMYRPAARCHNFTTVTAKRWVEWGAYSRYRLKKSMHRNLGLIQRHCGSRPSRQPTATGKRYRGRLESVQGVIWH